MTFNENSGGAGGRASGGSGGGLGGGSFGGGGMGGGGCAPMLLGMVLSRFGLPGIIIFALIMFFLNGGFGMFSGGGGGSHQGAPHEDKNALSHCKTWQDNNKYDDCRMQATAASLDQFWEQALPDERNIQYEKPKVFIGGGKMNTGCGAADPSQSGPFYCPQDRTVYLATPFFKQLREMGGSDGSFSQMYVIAHEFGHHIQNQEGTIGLSNYNDPGEDSNAVKMELQADCYAGLWASHADKGQNAMLDPISQEQVDQAVKSAQAIGDDAIQKSAGQQVNPDKWTHGSSEERVNHFLKGYQGGTMDSCKESFNR